MPYGTRQITAKLGSESVTVTRFIATEELSRPYRIQLDFLSTRNNLATADLIRQPASIRIELDRENNNDPAVVRFFHGLVNRFTYHGDVTISGIGGRSRYSAEIVPWFWFLTRTANCKVFQNQSVIQIAESIFKARSGVYSITKLPAADYPPREYCVQYRESDFAFVSRLLEEEGIFYYFRHYQDRHEMVLCDRVSHYYSDYIANGPIATPFGLPGTAAVTNRIASWEHEYRFIPGSATLTDYDYELPSLVLLKTEPTSLTLPAASNYELYDYPGEYLTTAEGEKTARVRMQEQEVQYNEARGTGHCPYFAPGARFILQGHPNAAENGERVIARVEHELTNPIDVPAKARVVITYANRFTCLPATILFRPERITPRPFVRGAQTAVVTGPADEERVHTDTQGRVKIKFHWDRSLANDDTSSCWVRVSQDWAGGGFGSMYLPHIGTEVIVDFLEGDPDRPVITGRLYNGRHAVPEALPDNKLRAIVAQDHAGNVIALDASENRVDIQNAEDKFELTVGESVTATAGMDVGITLGLALGVNLGASASIGLGASFDVAFGFGSSVFLGGSYDASFGGSFSYAKGNFVNAGDSVGQIAFKAAAEFVSHKSVMLAGGSKTNNSVVYAGSENLVLSYGPRDAKFAGSPGLALGLGVFGAAIVGTLGIGALGATAYLGAKAADTDDFTDYMAGSIATGVTGVAATAVAGVLLALYAKKWSQVKQSMHAVPLARLSLDDSEARLEGQKVNLVAKTELTLNAPSGLTANVPNAKFEGNVNVGGTFKTVNIMDLGNPAAPVQAAAQANAAVGQAAADAAADGAGHAAQQAVDAANAQADAAQVAG